MQPIKHIDRQGVTLTYGSNMSDNSQLTEAGARDYLEALAERQAKGIKDQINNSDLHAGSPMYYYCDMCPDLAHAVPETYFGKIKKYCPACQEMVDKGYSPTLKKFPGIL